MSSSQTWIRVVSLALCTLAAILLEHIPHVSALHCFECDSRDGDQPDCEDQFGPYNETGHLLRRDCTVPPLGFEAFHCVKVKGTKADGRTITIRSCSVEDWGSQCGQIHFEQPNSDLVERLTGCVASCNYDGCNGASSPLMKSQLRRVATSCFVLMMTLSRCVSGEW